jgi:spore coat protein U-like protein
VARTYEAHALVVKRDGLFWWQLQIPSGDTLTNSARRVEMKKLVLTIFAVSLVLTFAGRSIAADNADIDVQAEILGACTITTAPGLTDFGAIDPATYVTTTLTATVSFQCTMDEPWTVTLDGVVDPAIGPMAGPYDMNDGLGNLLAYSVDTTVAGNGLGLGAVDIDYPIDITLDQADVTLALPAGIYTDTFLFEINP